MILVQNVQIPRLRLLRFMCFFTGSNENVEKFDDKLYLNNVQDLSKKTLQVKLHFIT
jgi:hypothetical protein